MNNIGKYKELFEKEGIEVSENEISEIISNMNNIGNLFFSKYLIKVKNYESSSNI